MKKVAFLAICMALLTILIACNESPQPITTHNVVKMKGGAFTPLTITIKKGEIVAFVEDSGTGAQHILVIGQNAEQKDENGAPDFGGAAGIRVGVGQVWQSPPWTTAGTFHVTCTVHPNMNLTVLVT